MNQKKIGMFLKELRKEKQLTQEQLAEILGVTNRSISRWENGVNMPDFDLVIEIVKYFDVSIEEQTLLKVANYEKEENRKFSGKVCGLFIGAIVAFVLYSILDILGLTSSKGYEQIASCALGLVFGALLVGAIYTSRYMAKIQAFKLRVLHRVQKRDYGKEDFEKNGLEKGL